MNVRPGLIATAIAVGVMAVASMWAWTQVPAGAQVPVHWNFAGEVDRYGGKFEGLVLLPLVTLALSGLLAVIPRLGQPRRQNLERSARAYNGVWIGTLVLMVVIHLVAVNAATGPDQDLSVAVPLALGVLLLIIGNYLPKIRSNWFAGIRTPWTLTSERAWERTHRLGGRLFAALGAVVVLSAALGRVGVSAVLAAAGLFVITVVLTVYSYLAWRADQPTQDGPAG